MERTFRCEGLTALYEALLFKWLWRFINENGNLWKKVVTIKYGDAEFGWLFCIPNGSYGHSPWRYIPKGGEIFFPHFSFEILVEVDNLQDVPSPYIQIKGVDKEAVAAAGSMLKLDGSYTTKSYLQIILERLPALEANSGGVQTQQAAKLQELVEFIQSQGSSTSSESSPGREVSPVESAIEDLQCRVKRLERWQTINTVLWTFLMSAVIGYSLYQRRRR